MSARARFARNPSSNTLEGRGAGGSHRLKKRGAVCADRLAKNRTARTSGVFIGAINPAPITRESPLLPFADWKKPAVGLSRPQILELNGVGS